MTILCGVLCDGLSVLIDTGRPVYDAVWDAKIKHIHNTAIETMWDPFCIRHINMRPGNIRWQSILIYLMT